MKKITDYLIGSDFEGFLMQAHTGEIISAEGIVKGSKYEPFVFDPTNRFFTTSLDNVLWECNLPPTNSKEEWVKAILKGKAFIESILPEDVCIATLAAARLDEKWLQTENAKRIGCDHDNCVWTRSINKKPALTNLRSSGFHVHIGFPDPDIERIEALVKVLDLHLSVPAVLIEPASERKQLYGQAGCFRMPEHGVEYRSLSGYFASTPELSGWVFDNTEKAIKFVNDGRMDELEEVSEQIQVAINANDKILAGNLIRQFDLELV